MIKRIITVLLLALILCPAVAWAKPEVSVTLLAEKDVTVVENGQEVTKRVAAGTVSPGDLLIYTLSYSNKGDEVAKDVKFHSPIPEGTIYVDGSARAESADILFSIDNGDTYMPADKLQVKETGTDGQQVTRPATAKDYNSIRWIFPQLPAGAAGELTYQVQVN